MTNRTIVGTMVVIGLLILGGSKSNDIGDADARPIKARYLLFDTVNGDYWSEIGWTTAQQASPMTFWEAHRKFDDYRINELGEYANTGVHGYPVQVIEMNLVRNDSRR